MSMLRENLIELLPMLMNGLGVTLSAGCMRSAHAINKLNLTKAGQAEMAS